MKQILITLSLAALAVGCASRSERGAPGTISHTTTGANTAVATMDSSFARDAVSSGTAEVQMGQLAAKNTKSEAVRKLGEKLVEDHSIANKELEQIVTSKGIQAEKELAPPLKSSLDKLAGLKDSEFDQAFKQQAIQDHEKAIQLFEKEAKQGTDAELKAFAQKHLPHLRDHLAMAQKLEVGGATSETKTQVDDTAEQIKPTTPPDTTVPK